MTERMKTFIYCSITAIVTTIVVSAGQPQAAHATQLQGSIPSRYTINHVITFGNVRAGIGTTIGNTLIIKKL